MTNRRVRMSLAGNSPPNTRNASHVPTSGIGERDRVRDAQAGARQQVVGERVAGEPVEDREHEQRHADDPVELARPAERAGEEDAAEVGDDRREEQQRGPVVDLAHHEPGAHVEAEADRRLVRLRHRRRRAAGRSCRGRRPVLSLGTKKNVRYTPVSDEDDEAVHRDLADHERPVVGEDLVQRRCGRSARRRGDRRTSGRGA